MNTNITRRRFLQSTAVATTALYVGLNTEGRLAISSEANALNPFIRIDENGIVTVIIKHFEMGQGTTTGLATLLAEELDADWDTLQVELADADNKKYANLFFGSQGTGGSTAIANSYEQYRKAGAAAREMLVVAAAKSWGVKPDKIKVKKGQLHAGKHKAHFGEFIGDALKGKPNPEPQLKNPADFVLIGNETLHRKDNLGKISGQTIFAIDVKLPGMVYAVMLYPPRFGATLKSVDSSEAEKVNGFNQAKVLPDNRGVIVYASSTWSAIKARGKLKVEWDFSQSENRSTEELVNYHRGLLKDPTYQARKGVTQESAGKALENASVVIEQDFMFPFLAHAPMEPLNCVIEATDNGVRFHDGCQFPGITQPVVAKTLGLSNNQVEINTVYAGGSFGRRATPTSDYQVDAALTFDLLGRKTPVKFVWTREDDIKGGYYRPMAAHKARIGLDDQGNITGWDHRIAAKSILKGTSFEGMIKHGVDEASVEGIHDTDYNINNLSVGLSDAESAIPVLWWRSVGHTHTAYVMETLIDMIAEKAKKDPVEYRLALLEGGSKAQQRLAGVLKLAAKKAGWGKPLEKGHYQGLAVHKSFNSYVAEVVEISVDKNDKIKLEKVTCAVDCGVAINPGIIRAQMEGGIGYGLNAVMFSEISLSDGEVEQNNFPTYEPLRMKHMPQIDVHIIPSAEAPTGVGEPGVPPSGPALANAIYAATGKRITHLPMGKNGISFA